MSPDCAEGAGADIDTGADLAGSVAGEASRKKRSVLPGRDAEPIGRGRSGPARAARRDYSRASGLGPSDRT